MNRMRNAVKSYSLPGYPLMETGFSRDYSIADLI
jgi:hypothetical protein